MKTVVAVEDDPDIRTLIRMHLRSDDRLGLVGEVATAAEAVETATFRRPDLVILDHFLSGEVMGLQAAVLLKTASPTSKILLFTDYDLSVEAAREPAIDGYLSKTRMHDLLPTVLSLLSLAELS